MAEGVLHRHGIRDAFRQRMTLSRTAPTILMEYRTEDTCPRYLRYGRYLWQRGLICPIGTVHDWYGEQTELIENVCPSKQEFVMSGPNIKCEA